MKKNNTTVSLLALTGKAQMKAEDVNTFHPEKLE
jgi:hypothetical protein